MLTACATVAPPTTVNVSCATFTIISYAQLPRDERAKPREQQADPGNQADTPETVAQIQGFNARYEAMCPRAPVEGR